MTNAESTQANSHTIVTVQDDRLSNATSDHFFVSQMKKRLSKITTEMWNKCIKNKCLSDPYPEMSVKMLKNGLPVFCMQPNPSEREIFKFIGNVCIRA